MRVGHLAGRAGFDAVSVHDAQRGDADGQVEDRVERALAVLQLHHRVEALATGDRHGVLERHVDLAQVPNKSHDWEYHDEDDAATGNVTARYAVAASSWA